MTTSAAPPLCAEAVHRAARGPDPAPVRRTRAAAARVALAVAAAGAAVIHLSAAPSHLGEWPPLGLAFLAAAVLQLGWAAALLRRDSRRLLAAGAVGMLALVATWLASRTTGLPLGPHAGTAEPVGLADALCVLLEVPVAAGALLLLRRPAGLTRPAGRRTRAALAGVALAVTAAAGVAVAQPPHHGHAHPAATTSADLPGTPMVETGVDANTNGVDDGVEAYFAGELLKGHDDHEGHARR